MKINFTLLLSVLIIVFLIISCVKPEDNGNGMAFFPNGTNFSDKIKSNLRGHLEYCDTIMIGQKPFTLHDGETHEFLYEGQINTNGYFDFTYETCEFLNPDGIRVLTIEEDSTYFLVRDLENLELTMNDSIDLVVSLELNGNSLSSEDTLVYYFTRYHYFLRSLGVSVPEYKIIGPISQDTVVNRITKKWNIVETDVMGNVFHKIYWEKRNPNGTLWGISSGLFSSKESCLQQLDSVKIELN